MKRVKEQYANSEIKFIHKVYGETKFTPSSCTEAELKFYQSLEELNFIWEEPVKKEKA